MKIVKIVLGLLAGFCTVGMFVEFLRVLLSGSFSTVHSSKSIAAFVALCMFAALTIGLFQSAFRKRS